VLAGDDLEEPLVRLGEVALDKERDLAGGGGGAGGYGGRDGGGGEVVEVGTGTEHDVVSCLVNAVVPSEATMTRGVSIERIKVGLRRWDKSPLT
jgi:hypothetical protein